MKEYPLLCNARTVQAILDGRQTQDRRPINAAGNLIFIDRLLGEWSLSSPPYQYSGKGWNGGIMPWNWKGKKAPQVGDWFWELQSDVDDSVTIPIRCPFGQPGDRLWVRETWQQPYSFYPYSEDEKVEPGYHVALYRASPFDTLGHGYSFHWDDIPFWRPSIHMPRWASRITLEVVRVWVERVRDISEGDALAEGIFKHHDHAAWTYTWDSSIEGQWYGQARFAFFALWDSIYARRGLGTDANPWVWACEFKEVE